MGARVVGGGAVCACDSNKPDSDRCIPFFISFVLCDPSRILLSKFRISAFSWAFAYYYALLIQDDYQFEIIVNFFVGFYEAGVYVDSIRRFVDGLATEKG